MIEYIAWMKAQNTTCSMHLNELFNSPVVGVGGYVMSHLYSNEPDKNVEVYGGCGSQVSSLRLGN